MESQTRAFVLEELAGDLVWERISPTLDPSRGILVLAAPRGAARHQFARRWLGDEGRLVDPAIAPSAAADLLRSHAQDPNGQRMAAFLPATRETASLVRKLGGELVGCDELFLSPSDTAQLALQVAQPTDAEHIWALTGGWPQGLLMLLSEQASEDAVIRAFGRVMSPWLASIDPEGILAESAYLPELSEDLVAAFYADRYSPAPDVAALARAALAARNAAGGRTMPLLLQRALLEGREWEDPHRAEWLRARAVDAVQSTGRTADAVESALKTRSWRALEKVLAEGWIDLFTTNPLLLFKAGGAVPRWFSRRSEVYGPAMKIASAAAKDGMVIPFPTTLPNYAQDQTAHQLRMHAVRLGQRPNGDALSTGLVELGILRFHGHYGAEGSEAAQRLRQATQQATATGRVRPSLAAMAELQSGISFHLADEGWAAAAAYESALKTATTAQNHFLAADAAGKLALVKAQQGDTAATRIWLQVFSQHHGAVRWGAGMVGRAASLAQAYLAFHELDVEAMGTVLDSLPRAPDNDELWSVHALLLAALATGTNNSISGIQQVQELEVSRPYAASSPLARRSLTYAKALTAPLIQSDSLLGHDTQPEIRITLAMKHLHAGDSSGAGDILTSGTFSSAGLRLINTRRNIHRAIKYRDEPLPADDIKRVIAEYHSQGELGEMLPLWITGHGSQLAAALGLSVRQCHNLERFRSSADVQEVPRLTPRELQLLAGLRAGKSRTEMAREVFVSENTIKTQASSLYRKLGVRSKDEALTVASTWGY